jgi:tetratricopeptide (TPR) repeat protein
LEEAIKLRTDLLGDEDVELARLYVEKAVILRHQSKYNEALTNLEAALNIDNLHFIDENHVNFARILLEQGQIYLDKRSVDVAEEHLKAALYIYDIQPNRNVKQHADAVEALGRLYLQNGYIREASEMFNKVLEIRTAIYGSSHPEIAEALYYQAKTLLRMSEARENDGSKIEARQKLEQALSMLRHRDGDNAKLIYDIERTLADL